MTLKAQIVAFEVDIIGVATKVMKNMLPQVVDDTHLRSESLDERSRYEGNVLLCDVGISRVSKT